MEKREFKKEDFASFHPGGSLGKKLFIKIKDLMRTKALPIVDESTTVKDAVVSMSEGKLGTVLIVDKEKKFIALLSDGDLRRALMNETFSLDHLAITYATKGPKSYQNTELLASEALEIIENDRIQLLPITNEANEIIGVLHIHDLVNAGIKST
jgi:arabinose-5-phosphate isomerase